MRTNGPTNVDLLEWFTAEERTDCPSCARRTSVSLPELAASFCLGCGAISISGMRLDVGRTVPI